MSRPRREWWSYACPEHEHRNVTVPRLGEASGAALGLGVLKAAVACHAGMSTFADAADNAYLPSLVERPKLVRANGALEASGSAGLSCSTK